MKLSITDLEGNCTSAFCSGAVVLIKDGELCLGNEKRPYLLLEYSGCRESLVVSDGICRFFAQPMTDRGTERSYVECRADAVGGRIVLSFYAMHDCELMLKLCEGVLLEEVRAEGSENGVRLKLSCEKEVLYLTLNGACRCENGVLSVFAGRTSLILSCSDSTVDSSEYEDLLFDSLERIDAAKRVLLPICENTDADAGDRVSYTAFLLSVMARRGSFLPSGASDLCDAARELPVKKRAKAIISALRYLSSFGLTADGATVDEIREFLADFCKYKGADDDVLRDVEEILGLASENLTVTLCKRVIDRIEGI